MRHTTKRLLLSLLFCFGTILGWGFGCFFNNWRAYRDAQSTDKENQPIAVSSILTGLGIVIANIIFMAIWQQRPIEWIKPSNAIWMMLTGCGYCIGMDYYILAANKGAPASITGPITGLHVLVPPIWYVLFYRQCLGMKTVIGFTLSLSSLFLFSGLLSESNETFKITAIDWLVFLASVLGFGIGFIFQGEGAKGVSFKQFPQTFTFYTIGYNICSIIFACFMNASDITKRSNWVPFGVDHIITISSTVLTGTGAGLFSVCLVFADDLNLMVALSSLNIAIPAIFGILLLHETATWDIILGLVLALLGIIILSFEAKDQALGSRTSFSVRNSIPVKAPMRLSTLENVDKTPLLFEPLESSI